VRRFKLIGFFICCLIGFLSCKEEIKTVKPITITFKKEGHLSIVKKGTDSIIATFDIEIADTEYERQTGLMYRKRMDDNQAMLFVFPRSEPRSFYMKNTQISLDIIYFDAELELVSIQANTKPFDETSLPSEGIAKYVLEINAGLSEQIQLTKGDLIEYSVSKN
jgi:hypothetical protein